MHNDPKIWRVTGLLLLTPPFICVACGKPPVFLLLPPMAFYAWRWWERWKRNRRVKPVALLTYSNEVTRERQIIRTDAEPSASMRDTVGLPGPFIGDTAVGL